MQIVTRAYNPETDKSFIYSTWLKGLYYGNSYFGSIDKAVYFKRYENILDHILDKPDTEVRIAGLSDDADTILGYLVLEGSVVHWVHVKTGWRRQGIAKLLLGGSVLSSVSHLTPAGNSIRTKLKLGHNPFAI
jgi:hypothetical protein